MKASQEHYKYDTKGQLIEKLDKEGYLTSYSYTALGDISHIRYADGKEVTLSYSPLRYLEQIKDWTGTTKIHNDAMGRAQTVQYPDGREISYTYNAANQLISRVDAINEETYTYDKRGNLNLIMQNGTMKNSYTYGAINRLEQAVDAARQTVAYQYNGLGYHVRKTDPE